MLGTYVLDVWHIKWISHKMTKQAFQCNITTPRKCSSLTFHINCYWPQLYVWMATICNLQMWSSEYLVSKWSSKPWQSCNFILFVFCAVILSFGERHSFQIIAVLVFIGDLMDIMNLTFYLRPHTKSQLTVELWNNCLYCCPFIW